MKYIICSAALLACIAGTRWLVDGAFSWWGFSGGAVFSVCALALIFAIAFAVDAGDRRLRRAQQPKPLDHQP